MQKILTVLLLFITAAVSGQSLVLKGSVQDPEGLPLEAATVYFRSVKDSSVVDYTITDNKGNWQIKSRGFTQPVLLKISFVGFGTYQKRLESVSKDTDFGTTKLEEKGTTLNEVVIDADVPPVRVKKDTLEFDAASFKVRPDANVQTLLKQLPGVDISPDGKITVNGKEVNQILVNGKPFFDRDGKIALQSLPAELIKKVQVSDFKTKKEELQQKMASGDNASINLTIDKDKNKGVFGRITAGYGTNDRYEANGLVNFFKDKQKVSILASSNNINSAGFSNDDIFDSMGGGRNMQMWSGNDGSLYMGGTRIGGGEGITTSNVVGLNYSDEWMKGLDPSVSYFYNSTENKNRNRSRTETFLTDEGGALTDRSQIRTSEANSRSLNFAHNFNTEFDIKLDSTTTINFRPKFSRTNAKNESTMAQTTTDQDGVLLNNSSGTTLNDGDNATFSSTLTFNKVLNRRGRAVSAEFSNNNSNNESAYYNNTNTNVFNPETGEVIRNINQNQLQNTRRLQDRYNLNLSFTEAVTDSLNLEIGTEYDWENSTDDVKGYSFNETTAGYTNFIDSLTTYFSSTVKTLNPYLGLRLDKKKLNASVTLGTSIYNFDNNGAYRGIMYNVNKNYILPSADANIRYRFSRGSSIRVGYNFNASFPTARQILPIEDVSNALNTITGNPDLDPGKNHRISLNYNKFDFATRSGFSLYSSINIFEKRIVNNMRIFETGERITSYDNIEGGYNSYFGGSYYKTIKSESGNNIRYSLGLNGSYNRDLGFTNNVLYSAKTLSLTPNVNLNYDLGEVLTLNPSYSYTLTDSKYTNYARGSANNFTHRAGLIVTNYWPKHFVMGNDFTYTYNSIASGFRKDFFLWNTSIGYNFLKDQFMFKVKVYDLLNKNLGNRRTILATGISDEENTVLKRYAMFSLTWKINNFGGKKPGGQGGRRGGMRRQSIIIN